MADLILVGGAMANTFLAAQGHPVGLSWLEGDQEAARGYLDRAKASGAELVLPADVIVAADRSGNEPSEEVAAVGYPSRPDGPGYRARVGAAVRGQAGNSEDRSSGTARWASSR